MCDIVLHENILSAYTPSIFPSTLLSSPFSPLPTPISLPCSCRQFLLYIHVHSIKGAPSCHTIFMLLSPYLLYQVQHLSKMKHFWRMGKVFRFWGHTAAANDLSSSFLLGSCLLQHGVRPSKLICWSPVAKAVVVRDGKLRQCDHMAPPCEWDCPPCKEGKSPWELT